MIIILVITLLLGSSAVRSIQFSCTDLRHMTLKNIQGSFGDVSKIRYSNFDNQIKFEQVPSDKAEYYKNTEYALGAVKSDQILPQITVDGKSYKLSALSIRVIDQSKGIVSLIAFFSLDGYYKTPKTVVGIYIPLSLSDKNKNTDFNKELNKALSKFSTFPKEGTTTAVDWLKPLLEKTTQIIRPDSRRSYLTECVSVSKASVNAFLTQVKIPKFFQKNAVAPISLESCGDVQNTIVHNFKLIPGNPAAITPANFERRVQVERAGNEESGKTFIVTKSGQNNPKVIIDSKTYELYSFSFHPLDPAGAASLSIVFNCKECPSNEKIVTVLVPVLSFVNFIPEVNENLNEDLEALSKLSFKGQYNLSLAWLPELLRNVRSLKGHTNSKIFLVRCEMIFEDAFDTMIFEDATGNDSWGSWK